MTYTDKEEKLKKLLAKNPEGLTIQEISDKMKINRITVAIALAKLEGAGEITERKIGMAKLIFLKHGK